MHGNVSIVFGDKMKKDRETQLSGTFALSKSKDNPWGDGREMARH